MPLRFDEDNCRLLVEMLKENRTLVIMNLDGNDMSEEALLTLSEGLRKNRGLKTLSLVIKGHNPKLWCQFVSCLKENSHLTKLYLWGRGKTSVDHENEAMNETRRQQRCSLLTVHTRDLFELGLML